MLETYERANDIENLVVCRDGHPVQVVKEPRVPTPGTGQHGKLVDCEYERNGTASICVFAVPLSGFRQATAGWQRTEPDWAREVAHLLDSCYADCAGMTLGCDNLGTHSST